ncbi:hypothetical protein [Haematomicrobium sanguinis]|uniref:hypothetical protein n=1 Tax=Haematomicrobium sanguinis TaxID=479106 RepID=UPI00047C3865|nr:hypothetical protein [Haematomicrobium sanguinis]
MTTGEAATEAEYQGEWALILPQSWWQFPVHPLAAREKAKVRQQIVSILRSQITDIEKHAQMFAVVKGETVGALMPASLVVSSYPVGSFLQSVLSPLLSVTETIADFVKSGVIDPMAQFFGPKAPPQPQPAGN